MPDAHVLRDKDRDKRLQREIELDNKVKKQGKCT